MPLVTGPPKARTPPNTDPRPLAIPETALPKTEFDKALAKVLTAFTAAFIPETNCAKILTIPEII